MNQSSEKIIVIIIYHLPKNLLADEKYSGINSKRYYITMTVENEWISGAAKAKSASEADLTKAYKILALEVKALKPDYLPHHIFMEH